MYSSNLPYSTCTSWGCIALIIFSSPVVRYLYSANTRIDLTFQCALQAGPVTHRGRRAARDDHPDVLDHRKSPRRRRDGPRQTAGEEGREARALEVVDDPDAPPLRFENLEREEGRLPLVAKAVEASARASVRVDEGGAEAVLA